MPGSQRCRRSPTDDESSEDVDDEGDIHEAAPRGNVGQVRDPELVRACGVEVALHEVHRASAARIRLRRLESTSTDRPLEAHFTHQTGHRASSHVAALTAQLTPDLAHAIHVKVLLPYTTNLAAELDVALRSRWQAAWVLLSRFLLVIGRRGDRKHPADRLDPVTLTVRVHEQHIHLGRRSSSAWAKNADALRRISFARFSSRFSRSSSFSR